MLKVNQADPAIRGKLSYFKTLACTHIMRSPQNLRKAAKLSGFRSYHDLSKTIRKYFDLSVEEFLNGL